MPIRTNGNGFLDIGKSSNGVAPNCKEEALIASGRPVETTTYYAQEYLR